MAGPHRVCWDHVTAIIAGIDVVAVRDVGRGAEVGGEDWPSGCAAGEGYGAVEVVGHPGRVFALAVVADREIRAVEELELAAANFGSEFYGLLTC